ncbi:5-deoxy-glucuronate isomerase [Gordonia hirsuta DSM 44140 = NBRC 16056]|uniref:5-deoxy-glucuronate isomerase n=1 Tax=Gordonia hirsuta DSM 44140 = NBRC 16056 TaxID=1121927 RepID=L7L9F6_9ACTN|nr:5-deoxy-glucuronate isomerase [Gordonia hirsuta]GAC57780.1 5-deoxy-glucuronate isomerase [Gordonia hirsuta DSM 44140 = NBRC 16056]
MAPTPNEWFHPRGALTRHDWESVVDGDIDGWSHTGLRIAVLDDDAALDLPAGQVERIVVPLAGSFTVAHEDTVTRLHGRPGVFHGPTDVLYLGAGTGATVRGSGRVAVTEAPTAIGKPTVYLAAADVPVEVRGAGRDTRQVHNFGTPQALDAAALIVCEVITPGGNWSSHPAHKHDEHVPGHESRLEEIYYFEAAPARQFADAGVVPEHTDAFGSFVTYSSPAGDIDTNVIVRTGDIALVPYGYHGPAMAAPEYDLYYLNVMAGPDPERIWLISDDPQQAWLRDTWPLQDPDPRLPYLPDPASAPADPTDSPEGAAQP